MNRLEGVGRNVKVTVEGVAGKERLDEGGLGKEQLMNAANGNALPQHRPTCGGQIWIAAATL